MTQPNNFRADIAAAVKVLKLGSHDFKLVSFYEYENILLAILDGFTTLGKTGLNYFWWWDSFKTPTYSVQLKYTPVVLPELVTLEEIVWFVAEDWGRTKKNGNFWLYEGKVAAIIEIIGEMYGFEYYIVSKKFEWLLCENHHNILFGVGCPIVEKMKYLRLDRENTI